MKLQEGGIRKLSYELYKTDWMQRISAERQTDAIKNYYEAADSYEGFEEWLDENGYDGELYVCYDEFMGAEYLDKDYILYLIGDNEKLKAEYAKDYHKVTGGNING